ncbi:TetR/AcrR family transcriptional regulator [Actinomadura logoneensis]|uniref:TetR/AcrR family transcriptional regulator n=1 Tax=Actinomadura logoneensis TaxID=2293572 RepID=A0A372JHT1_9ACTN|nr:TetR family transcriptional regulator [Actinomadura logoneensis]RFU39563.1 TetR/AcrR family transcriptional regulator [Actinomadura logoneensis]
MAWDTERTRRLILEAAVEEFATHGPEAARMDRIAAGAGVNKERIYSYFGNKRKMFAVVLTRELQRLAEAVPLDEHAASDLGEYAGRVFDYHREHPHFVRLLHWEGLHASDGEPVAARSERTAHYSEKIAALAAAQAAGRLNPEVAPGELLYAVIALAGWWFATPQLQPMLMPGLDDDPDGRRAALVRLVRLLGAVA